MSFLRRNRCLVLRASMCRMVRRSQGLDGLLSLPTVLGRGQPGEGRRAEFADIGATCGLGNASGAGLPGRESERSDDGSQLAAVERTGDDASRLANPNGGQPSDGELQRGRRLVQLSENPLAGFWRDADWLLCTDEKVRPVEAGTFPLASGAPKRLGRLRGYGNALCAPQAQAFVESVMGCLP